MQACLGKGVCTDLFHLLGQVDLLKVLGTTKCLLADETQLAFRLKGDLRDFTGVECSVPYTDDRGRDGDGTKTTLDKCADSDLG